MLTKEEYKREFVRMMDTVREDHKGEKNCDGRKSELTKTGRHFPQITEVLEQLKRDEE